MATASHISLNPSTAGVYHVPSITDQSAKLASDLLQQNHDNYHIYFNKDGFHNHIAHHLLAIYALGATESELQKAYDDNSSYQRSAYTPSSRNVEDMSDPTTFAKFLGKEKYYSDFLTFFADEINSKGYQTVLTERLFAHTPQSEDFLARMFAGFYHPLIHLGYGIEFQQPAVIAEALAQAAIHDNWDGRLLFPAEEAARAGTQSSATSRTLHQLLNECRSNEKLKSSPHYGDSNKIRDGILIRAPQEMINIISQYTITPPTPTNLRKRTAEMVNNAIFFASAAQNPTKIPKFDFFYMHCVNSSIFFSAFMKEDWLKNEDKARLLEWKGRFDIAMYVSRGSPELHLDEIQNYKPKNPNDGWAEIIKRVDGYADDGHASKLIRAIAHGEAVCKEYEAEAEDAGFVIKGDMWLKIGHMAIDSVEAGGPRWARNVGWDQAWNDVPDRAKL